MVKLNDIISSINELPLSKTLEFCIQYATFKDDLELLKWASLELNGYFNSNKYLTEDVVVPEYRTDVGQYADYNNNPIIVANPEMQFILEDRLRHGVPELENFLVDSKSIAFYDSKRAAMLKKELGMDVYSYSVGTYQIETIFSSIKSKLYELLKTRIPAIDDSSIVKKSSPLRLSDLHPMVIQIAEPLFIDGHYREAVLNVFIGLVNYLKTKSQKYELDGVPLAQTVLSQKKPILKISDDADEQLGYQWLFSGAIMGIRNTNAHNLTNNFNNHSALEWLSFASALFRILDEAIVVKYEK